VVALVEVWSLVTEGGASPIDDFYCLAILVAL